MPPRDAYHHGDLRKALIEAGEAVLQQTGVDQFSLRQVARQVGVSHSAPAHHFGDANGLLDAIAAEGFRRLLRMMESYNADYGPDPRDALTGSGIGYVRFAISAPATFGLMFGPKRMPSRTPDLQFAGMAAFEHLARHVEDLQGAKRGRDPTIMPNILACWSMVHGVSDLLISGGLADVLDKPQDEQTALFASLIRRALP